MVSSISDYGWWRDFSGGALEAHCVTLARGLTPREFLGRLGAVPQGDLAGFGAFMSLHWKVLERLNHGWGDFFLVGAVEVSGGGGPWTLALELNGIVGVEPSLMSAATAGTTAVSHFMNVNGLGRFCAWRDGVLTTGFEWPSLRSGSDPDALDAAVARIGGIEPGRHKADRYLVLGEELTGVKITSELLTRAVYTAGVVAVSPRARADGWSWEPTPREAAREADIRAWLHAQGVKVPPGPLRSIMIEMYEAAHG
ncbi:DUF6461 domain-containing protein [Actinocorallia sp. B10E7]|uniref:DUF6461 domain-containing protein n=1 Tax=Actinocorallia sp. B10E7 TaxID=3153558 RepID=UPI00325E4685